MLFESCYSLPIIDLPILILVCKVKHLLNILLVHRHRQVPHHELEVSLGEEFVLDFVLFSSEVGGVGISAANNLKKLSTNFNLSIALDIKLTYLEEGLVEELPAVLPVLPEDQPAEVREVDQAIDSHLISHVYHLLLCRV